MIEESTSETRERKLILCMLTVIVTEYNCVVFVTVFLFFKKQRYYLETKLDTSSALFQANRDIIRAAS